MPCKALMQLQSERTMCWADPPCRCTPCGLCPGKYPASTHTSTGCQGLHAGLHQAMGHHEPLPHLVQLGCMCPPPAVLSAPQLAPAAACMSGNKSGD
jgi:hypothetical protein